MRHANSYNQSLESEFFYDDASRSKFVNRVLSDIAHHYGGSTNDFMMSFDRITGLLADFHVSGV